MTYSVVRDFEVDHREMRLHSSGVGPPVLLLHELAGSCRSFSPIVPALVAAGREVVALDLPGHGKSAAVPGSDLGGIAWAVAGALDEVTTDPIDVVGVDLGGYVGLTLASTFGNRIRRLVVVEPQAPPRSGRAGAGIVPPAQRARGALTVLRQGRHGLNQMHTVLDQLRSADAQWWDGLSSISAPTLVIDGGSGGASNGVDLDALADAIPDAKRLRVGSGHRFWAAHPQRFTDLVMPFLGS